MTKEKIDLSERSIVMSSRLMADLVWLLRIVGRRSWMRCPVRVSALPWSWCPPVTSTDWLDGRWRPSHGRLGDDISVVGHAAAAGHRGWSTGYRPCVDSPGSAESIERRVLDRCVAIIGKG